MSDLIDRFVSLDQLGWPGEHWLQLADPGATIDEWYDAIIAEMRRMVARIDHVTPDRITARFEAQALTDPSIQINRYLERHGVEQRRLERIVTRDFGLTPKQVLLRARALDMASLLRGITTEAEADDIILRYFDHSHLTRDFQALFGMSPKQFFAQPQPLMTLALSSRQARRQELLARVAPAGIDPLE